MYAQIPTFAKFNLHQISGNVCILLLEYVLMKHINTHPINKYTATNSALFKTSYIYISNHAKQHIFHFFPPQNVGAHSA
jgi:hypothetical protein